MPDIGLGPGERVLWSGRAQRSPWRLFDVVAVGWGAFWIAGVVVPPHWLGAPPFFVVSFLAAGCAMWFQVYRRPAVARSTTYFVTDRKLVVEVTRPRWVLRSEALRSRRGPGRGA